MVDETRRQRFQLEIAHPITADNHRGTLFVEGFDDLLKRLRRGIKVVAVELHGESTAMFVENRHIPASANAQISTMWRENHQIFVFRSEFRENFGGSVGGMVIDHDDIIGKLRFLRKRTFHGIGDGFCAVENGNDNRCLDAEILLVEVDFAVGSRVDQCAEFRQMNRAGAFHLDLHLPIARIHVVKLLFAALARVLLDNRVKRFVQVEKQSATA